MAIGGAASAVEETSAARHRAGMTCDRARAHARVTMTLAAAGTAALLPAEHARTHSAANALFFCADIAADRSARAAFSDFERVRDQLVTTGRWTRERAGRLADDVRACGPGMLA